MKKFSETVADFLNELSHYTGRAPLFSIDYHRNKLIIADAPSGFISQLAKNDRWLISLVAGEGIHVEKFAD